jgi:hypothetical protein
MSFCFFPYTRFLFSGGDCHKIRGTSKIPPQWNDSLCRGTVGSKAKAAVNGEETPLTA